MSDIRDPVKHVPDLATARSFLFAPGGDERKLTKALDAGADAIVADLEDATPADGKDAARALVAAVLGEHAVGCLRLVRVNGVGTSWFDDDLAAVSRLPLDGLVTHHEDAGQAERAYRTAFGDNACLKMVIDLRGTA